MIITGIRTKERVDTKQEKKTIILDASALKYECIKERYHIALKKCQQTKNQEDNIDGEYRTLTKKLKKAADEALRSARAPLTPIRKKALNRLRKAVRLVNKHPDMLPYKWKLRDRRQECENAIRSHNERKIRKFYNELNDFDVAVRIKKSYQFLKQFMKRKTMKKTHIPMTKWNETLQESEGPV